MNAPLIRRLAAQQRIQLPLELVFTFAWGYMLVALFATSDKFGAMLDQEARTRVQRPVGEWNSIRVVNDHNVVTPYINGALIGRGSHPFTNAGWVIFQLEGVAMRFRNIRIRALAD